MALSFARLEFARSHNRIVDRTIALEVGSCSSSSPRQTHHWRSAALQKTMVSHENRGSQWEYRRRCNAAGNADLFALNSSPRMSSPKIKNSFDKFFRHFVRPRPKRCAMAPFLFIDATHCSVRKSPLSTSIDVRIIVSNALLLWTSTLGNALCNIAGRSRSPQRSIFVYGRALQATRCSFMDARCKPLRNAAKSFQQNLPANPKQCARHAASLSRSQLERAYRRPRQKPEDGTANQGTEGTSPATKPPTLVTPKRCCCDSTPAKQHATLRLLDAQQGSLVFEAKTPTRQRLPTSQTIPSASFDLRNARCDRRDPLATYANFNSSLCSRDNRLGN